MNERARDRRWPSFPPPCFLHPLATPFCIALEQPNLGRDPLCLCVPTIRNKLEMRRKNCSIRLRSLNSRLKAAFKQASHGYRVISRTTMWREGYSFDYIDSWNVFIFLWRIGSVCERFQSLEGMEKFVRMFYSSDARYNFICSSNNFGYLKIWKRSNIVFDRNIARRAKFLAKIASVQKGTLENSGIYNRVKRVRGDVINFVAQQDFLQNFCLSLVRSS